MQGCHSFRQFPIYLSLSGYLDKLMFFGLTEISLYRKFLMEILNFYHNHKATATIYMFTVKISLIGTQPKTLPLMLCLLFLRGNHIMFTM